MRLYITRQEFTTIVNNLDMLYNSLFLKTLVKNTRICSVIGLVIFVSHSYWQIDTPFNSVKFYRILNRQKTLQNIKCFILSEHAIWICFNYRKTRSRHSSWNTNINTNSNFYYLFNLIITTNHNLNSSFNVISDVIDFHNRKLQINNRWSSGQWKIYNHRSGNVSYSATSDKYQRQREIYHILSRVQNRQ